MTSPEDSEVNFDALDHEIRVDSANNLLHAGLKERRWIIIHGLLDINATVEMVGAVIYPSPVTIPAAIGSVAAARFASRHLKRTHSETNAAAVNLDHLLDNRGDS